MGRTGSGCLLITVLIFLILWGLGSCSNTGSTGGLCKGAGNTQIIAMWQMSDTTAILVHVKNIRRNSQMKRVMLGICVLVMVGGMFSLSGCSGSPSSPSKSSSQYQKNIDSIADAYGTSSKHVDDVLNAVANTIK